MPTSPARLPSRSSVWSVLQHLEHLDPPPSYPSLDCLSSYPTSGSIPIAFGSAISPPYSSDQLVNTAESPGLHPSCSVGSDATAGTFGPIEIVLKGPLDVQPSGASHDLASAPQDHHSVVLAANQPSPPIRHNLPLGQHSFDNQSSLAKPALPSSPTTTPRCESVHLDAPRDRIAQLSPRQRNPSANIEALIIAPSTTVSTLPSPIFAQPSTAFTDVSVEPSPVQDRFPRALESAVKGDIAPRTPNNALKHKLRRAVSKGRSLVNSSSPPLQMNPPRLRPGSDFVVIADTDKSSSSSPTPLSIPPLPSVTSVDKWRFADLPVSLSWLKGIAVELMIDQEGFRAVRPTFKLVGYTGPPSPVDKHITLADHDVYGQADFMPTKRDAFVFHHFALDAPPILRRVLINGDESRDYTTRQASLSMKSNGAYSVRGTEAGHGESESPLVWQFDYFVGSKRNKEGRPVPGEKTLTPLCFSCSPGLLHPTNAKKVRIVHVVRKSVVAKLAAEKLMPPAPPAPSLSGPARSNRDHMRRASNENANHNSSKEFGKHRRTRSHAPPSIPKTRAPLPLPALSPSISYHAGFLDRRPMRELDPGCNVPVPSRHIVQKDVLTALLDAHTSTKLVPLMRPPLRRASQPFGL